MLNFIYWYASEKVGKSLHKALNLKVPPPSLQLRKSTANTSIVCTVYPSSVIILFIVVCTFCFHSSVFFLFIHAFSQIYLVPSFYTFVFIYSLPFDLSMYLSIQLFISSFVLQPVLNVPASYSLCFSLTSFHYILFLIFHLLIICPLILFVFPSVSFFLYTSFKRILYVVLLRNRSVLMFIRCQFKCISELNALAPEFPFKF